MFSVLTSKIFGAASLVLLAALASLYLWMSGQISSLEKQIVKKDATIEVLRTNNTTLKANQGTLETAVNACNTSVKNSAAVAKQAADNGLALLAEVRKGAARTSSAISNLEAMPTQTCEDAEAILRAGAQP